MDWNWFLLSVSVLTLVVLSFSVQAGIPKPSKPRQEEEEAMDATSQAEASDLSAERWVTHSISSVTVTSVNY